MAVRHWLFGLLGFALGVAPLAVSAEPSTGARLLDALQAGQSRLQALLGSHIKPIERDSSGLAARAVPGRVRPGPASGRRPPRSWCCSSIAATVRTC